jgi:hypothetical protein
MTLSRLAINQLRKTIEPPWRKRTEKEAGREIHAIYFVQIYKRAHVRHVHDRDTLAEAELGRLLPRPASSRSYSAQRAADQADRAQGPA